MSGGLSITQGSLEKKKEAGETVRKVRCEKGAAHHVGFEVGGRGREPRNVASL